MYLSKLELQGFKSFADKTTLEFAPGITAIVGPNGCGKSNIVDAVRWVIGEQRASVLRSDKMNDVIFNGTSHRRPLGMSEVQLTVENNRGVLPTEYSEVSIGRRLFRSGDSEYLLNDVKSRLKDIQGLFMDTGMGAGAYSVIELKMVEEILSDSAEERRHLFEEAAGITKYKQRRRQALRKLDQTQSDLERVRDLTDEVEKNVRRLKRQAKKAARFNEMESRRIELELQVAQADFDHLATKQRTYRSEQQEALDRIEELTAQIDGAEARLEAIRLRIVEQEERLSERQQELSAHLERMRELETEQKLLRQRVENARTERGRVEREREQASDRLEALERELATQREALEIARPAVEQAEAALAEREQSLDSVRSEARSARDALRELRGEEKRAASHHAETQRRLDRLTNRLELLEKDRERLFTEVDELEVRVQELAARRDALRSEREEAQAQAEEAATALEAARETQRTRRETLEEKKEALRKAERQRDAAAAEADVLESLVSSYDEFSDAVQFLASDASWRKEPLRTVADLVACDDELRAAVDAALGELSSTVVVRDDEEAIAALRRLKEEDAGRASLFVLDRLNGVSAPADGPGHSEALRTRVRSTDPEGAPLLDRLLQEVFLVDDLASAREHAARHEGQFVTREGEWASAEGRVFGGGSSGGGSGVAGRFGRREQLDEVRERLDRLERELTERTEEVDAAREALAEIPLDEFEEKQRELQRAADRARQAFERAEYEHQQATRSQAKAADRLEGIEAEHEEESGQVDALREELAEAKERLSTHQAAREEAEQVAERAEDALRTATAAQNEARLEAVQARNRRDSLQREVERAESTREELEERIETAATRYAALGEQIEEHRARLDVIDEQLAELHGEREGYDQRVNEARAQLNESKATVSEIENELRTTRREQQEAVKRENDLQVRLAEVNTRTQDLLENVLEEHERQLQQVPVALPEGFDVDEARSERNELRKKIKRLGNVNPLALEEYEEEKERFDFLTSQRDDLGEAEETLLDTITEINDTASQRFVSTFEEIKKNFLDIFSQLFQGDAKAELYIEDLEQPLDSPIAIMAQPRGKRPSVLSQLSSGEKTLTAIALLFAIYLVKPSPFCILDEVDAPLDDTNVQRFMRLIEEFSDRTQFILVTHNKLTMEAADRLYGITMQEQGVSKLVSVRFDEAVEIVG